MGSNRIAPMPTTPAKNTADIAIEMQPTNLSTGSLHRDAERPVSGQFESDLPPWKKQMLLNRMRKDKEQERREREKVLVDNSKGAQFVWVLTIDNIIVRHEGNFIFHSDSDRPFYYMNTSNGEEF